MGIKDVFDNINWSLPILRTVIVLIIVFLAFTITLNFLTHWLLKKVKGKKQISNIKIFSNIIKYIFFIILVFVGIFTYADNWTGLGLAVGLLSAALGWALQRPITGIAGWVMVVTKRPFEIGDRIVIGTVRGDVEEISLTHIYIKEIGGIVSGEENSGRIVMVPNAKLFEQDITNYTLNNEFVLDQVATTFTFEGNLNNALKICLEAAKKYIREFENSTKKKPYTLTYFEPNGINVRVRYFAPANRLQEFSSKITKEIYDNVMKDKKVEFAYPHTEIIYRKK